MSSSNWWQTANSKVIGRTLLVYNLLWSYSCIAWIIWRCTSCSTFTWGTKKGWPKVCSFINRSQYPLEYVSGLATSKQIISMNLLTETWKFKRSFRSHQLHPDNKSDTSATFPLKRFTSNKHEIFPTWFALWVIISSGLGDLEKEIHKNIFKW